MIYIVVEAKRHYNTIVYVDANRQKVIQYLRNREVTPDHDIYVVEGEGTTVKEERAPRAWDFINES